MPHIYTVSVVKEAGNCCETGVIDLDQVHRSTIAFTTLDNAIKYLHQIPCAVARKWVHNEDYTLQVGTFKNSALEEFWIQRFYETEYDVIDFYDKKVWKKQYRDILQDVKKELNENDGVFIEGYIEYPPYVKVERIPLDD